MLSSPEPPLSEAADSYFCNITCDISSKLQVASDTTVVRALIQRIFDGKSDGSMIFNNFFGDNYNLLIVN